MENNFGNNKIRLGQFEETKIRWGGPKIEKIWGKSCSCNNWRLPGEHRSLNNLLFDQQTTLMVPLYYISSRYMNSQMQDLFTLIIDYSPS